MLARTHVALEGKVAVITGGAAGIGLCYARRFLAEGRAWSSADIVDPPAADKLGAARASPRRFHRRERRGVRPTPW